MGKESLTWKPQSKVQQEQPEIGPQVLNNKELEQGDSSQQEEALKLIKQLLNSNEWVNNQGEEWLNLYKHSYHPRDNKNKSDKEETVTDRKAQPEENRYKEATRDHTQQPKKVEQNSAAQIEKEQALQKSFHKDPTQRPQKIKEQQKQQPWKGGSWLGKKQQQEQQKQRELKEEKMQQPWRQHN